MDAPDFPPWKDFKHRYGDELVKMYERLYIAFEELYGLSSTAMANGLGLPQSSVHRTMNPDLEARPGTFRNRLLKVAEKLSNTWGLPFEYYASDKGPSPDYAAIRARGPLLDEPNGSRTAEPAAPPMRLLRRPDEAEKDYVEHVFAAGHVGASEAGGVEWDEGEVVRTPREIMLAWTGGRDIPRTQGWWTKVRGTSMEPWLPDGTPIFVERTEEINGGGRYVLWLDDDDAEVVKRVERLGSSTLLLISDNTAHPSRKLHRIKDAEDPNTYRDETFNMTVRVVVRGRVVFPADTPQAILRTVTDQLATVLKPQAAY